MIVVGWPEMDLVARLDDEGVWHCEDDVHWEKLLNEQFAPEPIGGEPDPLGTTAARVAEELDGEIIHRDAVVEESVEGRVY